MTQYGLRLVDDGVDEPHYVAAPWNAPMIASVIESHAQQGDTLTANNVWRWIGEDAVLESPTGTMGMGFKLARRAGIIVSTGEVMQSTHPSRKGGMVRVWRWL